MNNINIILVRQTRLMLPWIGLAPPKKRYRLFWETLIESHNLFFKAVYFRPVGFPRTKHLTHIRY